MWEAAMCAGNYELDTLCAIVDYNRISSMGVEDIQSLERYTRSSHVQRNVLETETRS